MFKIEDHLKDEDNLRKCYRIFGCITPLYCTMKIDDLEHQPKGPVAQGLNNCKYL